MPLIVWTASLSCRPRRCPRRTRSCGRPRPGRGRRDRSPPCRCRRAPPRRRPRRRGCRHCPHPVHQVGQHRVATSPHVDRGSGRVVADGEPGLSGRDLGGVVDVRREPRLAGLVQVIDDGDVRTGRHAHPVRLHARLPVGTVSGGDDIEVVVARRQGRRVGQRSRLEVREQRLAAGVDVDHCSGNGVQHRDLGVVSRLRRRGERQTRPRTALRGRRWGGSGFT